MAGCCGSKRANQAYVVTLKDGSEVNTTPDGKPLTMEKARMIARADDSVDPAGRRKAATIRTVLKTS